MLVLWDYEWPSKKEVETLRFPSPAQSGWVDGE